MGLTELLPRVANGKEGPGTLFSIVFCYEIDLDSLIVNAPFFKKINYLFEVKLYVYLFNCETSTHKVKHLLS